MLKLQLFNKSPELMISYQYFTWPTIIICIFVVVINQLYRLPLYELGIEQILSMQVGDNKFFQYFFLFVTMIIDPTVIVGACIFVLIITKNKAKGLVMIIFILFNSFLAAALKAYDSDPRPFWTNPEVKSIGFYCPVQYGNPSGHSWFSAVFGFGILLDYCGSGNNNINIWISIAAVILMPLSRMYLGAHSLNQVLEGVLLGLGMCLLYVIVLKQLIFKFLSEFNRTMIWKYVIGVLHILYVIPFLTHLNEQLPEQWQKNILGQCNTQMNEQKLNALMFLVNALFVNIITGIAMGYQPLSKSKEGENYLTGNWQINQQKHELTRGYLMLILIQALCLFSGFAIVGLVYFFIPFTAVRFVGVSIGGYISGYVYTAKSCQLLIKYKVIRQIEI